MFYDMYMNLQYLKYTGEHYRAIFGVNVFVGVRRGRRWASSSDVWQHLGQLCTLSGYYLRLQKFKTKLFVENCRLEKMSDSVDINRRVNLEAFCWTWLLKKMRLRWESMTCTDWVSNSRPLGSSNKMANSCHLKSFDQNKKKTDTVHRISFSVFIIFFGS